jgi:hypothetical protein
MEDHQNHQQIAHLAYQFWLERGCPVGSSHEDWFRAERALQSSRIEDVEANPVKGGPVQIAADSADLRSKRSSSSAGRILATD